MPKIFRYNPLNLEVLLSKDVWTMLVWAHSQPFKKSQKAKMLSVFEKQAPICPELQNRPQMFGAAPCWWLQEWLHLKTCFSGFAEVWLVMGQWNFP